MTSWTIQASTFLGVPGALESTYSAIWDPSREPMVKPPILGWLLQGAGPCPLLVHARWCITFAFKQEGRGWRAESPAQREPTMPRNTYLLQVGIH